MYRLVFTKDGDPDTKFQWRDPFDHLPDEMLDQALEEYPEEEGYTPTVENLSPGSGDTSIWVGESLDEADDDPDDS